MTTCIRSAGKDNCMKLQHGLPKTFLKYGYLKGFASEILKLAALVLFQPSNSGTSCVQEALHRHVSPWKAYLERHDNQVLMAGEK